MKVTIRGRLFAGFGTCFLFLTILLVYNLFGLFKLEKLYHEAVRRTGEMELATDARYIGADLYVIIADTIINRNMAKSEKDWISSKELNWTKFRRVEAIADTPEEVAYLRKAEEAFSEIVFTYEKQMLPLVTAGEAIPVELAAMDAKLDGQVEAIRAAMTRAAESISRENNDATREFRELFHKTIELGLASSLIAMFAALLIAALTTRRITRFLSELTMVAREMEKGNYGIDLKHRSDDETGVFANAFRNMAEQVSKRTVELEELNDHLQNEVHGRKLIEERLEIVLNELDAKVKERTADLFDTNAMLMQEISMHRQTGEALRKSEERYRSLVEATAQIVWTTGEDGNVLEDMPSWRAFTGQGEEEVKGWGWIGALHPEDVQNTRAVWSHALETRTLYQVEYRLRRHDGEYRHFMVRGVPVLNKEGVIREWVGTCTDITERKRGEDELRKREACLKEAQRIAHIGHWELELADNRLLWSDEMYRIFEIESGAFDATYEAFLETIHPEDRRLVDNAYRGSIENKSPYSIVHRLRMRDGRVKYVHEQCETAYDRDGNPVRSVGTTQDITDRVLAEQELSESLKRERFLADVIRNASVGIAMGRPDWGIVPLNTAILEITGYTDEELQATDMGDNLTPPQWREREEQCLSELRRTGKPVTYEKEYFRKDGSTVPVQLVVHWLSSGGDYPEQYVTFVTDISSGKAAEAERQRLEAKVRQAQKMEAIGTLAGGIAHDFNNILSAIIGYTELAITKTSEASPLASYLREVHQAARRAADLVRQILTFSRKTEQECRAVQVSSIIKEALKLLRPSLPSTIEIRRHIDPSCRCIMADPTQIHQVIINLCANAAHAMSHGGGILDVKLSDIKIDGENTSTPQLKPGPYLCLSVSDTGHGMDKETMQRIFEPFFTTKPKGEGTGMGLAVVHGIMQSCGGAISVHSEPGAGTRFTLYFPSAVSGTMEYFEESFDAPAGQGRILFVDDERALAQLGRIKLGELGYMVTAKTSSLEALEVFRARPDHFDLVITDHTMPGMTGLDLAIQIGRIRGNTPVILCTGYRGSFEIGNMADFGIRELIYKPIQWQLIARAIKRILNGEIAELPSDN